MSVCLEYQSVYLDRSTLRFGVRVNVLIILLLSISLLYKIWIKLESVELGYDIAAIREEIQRLDYERQELELQYSVATRPDILARRAYDELNLKAPRTDQVIRLVPEGVGS